MSGDHNMNQKHDGENLLYVAYEVDWDKVQTLDDLKRVIQSMGIRFNGDHWIKGVEDLVRVVK